MSNEEQIKKNKFGFKPVLLVIITLLTLMGIYFYWHYTERFSSTDDAYLNANIVQVASRVTGQVAHLYVVDNQFVKAGQALLDLDVDPFNIAIAKAKAQLAMDQATLTNAQVSSKRLVTLVQEHALPLQSQDDANAKVATAAAAVQFDQANLQQAELNLQYAHVVAPTSGWITNMSLVEGNNINANQSLFALVSNSEFWVDANFKETQLANVHPGQTASIQIDMYDNHAFKGIVESISSGSGTAFSLLPPENATGNWVKVTQRVPVRIRVLNPDPNHPLRIGTSAVVSIDTHS